MVKPSRTNECENHNNKNTTISCGIPDNEYDNFSPSQDSELFSVLEQLKEAITLLYKFHEELEIKMRPIILLSRTYNPHDCVKESEGSSFLTNTISTEVNRLNKLKRILSELLDGLDI
jgi:hypothetical protein